MRRPLWASIVAVAVAVPVVTVLGAGFGHDPNAVRSPVVNHQAPAFTLRSFDGRQASLASLRGKPVVVNFWASWCVGCKDEHADLVQGWRTYGRQVAFVGIDYHDRIADARSFLHRYGGGWPQLQDQNDETAIDFGVYGVPETYFIDRQGIVRYKSTGPVTWDVLKTQIRRIAG